MRYWVVLRPRAWSLRSHNAVASPCRRTTSSTASSWPRRRAATDEVLNPATGAVICEVASSDGADADAAVEAGARTRSSSWSRTTPRERFEALTKLADAVEADLAGAEAARIAERRQAGVDHRLRVRPDRRQPPVLRGRRPVHGRPGGRGVPRGPHLLHPPRPHRRDRGHRPVELPAQHGDLEDRPGASRPATRWSSSRRSSRRSPRSASPS